VATAQTKLATLDVRQDFPVLRREDHGREIAYLDSAATSQKPRAMIDAITSYYEHSNANIHRGTYALAQEATELFEGARERIATFLGGDPKTTIFTRNATEAVNLVAYAWGRANVGPGDEVLITQMEHHANLVPWQLLCSQRGATLRYLTVSEEGRLSLDQLDETLGSGKVKLLATAHISNVLGTINPVAEMVARARAAGAATLIDGSQSVPQMPVDIEQIGADFFVWTGHKALGPTGIGVLHGRRETLEAMPPFLSGGDMIATVDYERSTWNELPWKFEAGTSAVAEAVGLGAAIDYLGAIGMDAVRDHERDLTSYALGRLAEIAGLSVVGPSTIENRGGVISFTLEGLHPHDISELCDRDSVCIRAGKHCAHPLMLAMGVPATARASFHVYNNHDDVDRLVDALTGAQELFGV